MASGGESVLVPPGRVVIGVVSVETGSSLDVEGAIVAGAVSFNTGPCYDSVARPLSVRSTPHRRATRWYSATGRRRASGARSRGP